MSQIIQTKIGNKIIKHFTSRNFVAKNKKYTIVSTEKKDSGQFIHTVKNDQGEYKDFDHDALVMFIEENESSN